MWGDEKRGCEGGMSKRGGKWFSEVCSSIVEFYQSNFIQNKSLESSSRGGGQGDENYRKV